METRKSLLARVKDGSFGRYGKSKFFAAFLMLVAVAATPVAAAITPVELLSYIVGDSAAVRISQAFSPASWTAEAAAEAMPTEIQVCVSGCEFSDLAGAVAAAAPGSTIVVQSGSYILSTAIVIDKPLNIVGPNAATPAYGSRGVEAVIVPASTGAFIVKSDAVTISGFRFEGSSRSTTLPTIAAGSEFGGKGGRVIVSNNVFENPEIEQARVQSVVIARSRNSATIQVRGAQFGDWIVQGNDFRGTLGTAVRFTGTNGAATVAANRFSDIGGAGVQVSGTDGVVVDGNWFDGIAEEGVKIGAAAVGTVVRGNTISRAQLSQNPVKGGIWIEANAGAGTRVENNLITESLNAVNIGASERDIIIRTNHFAKSNARGLYASNADSSVTVNAQNNYWGSPNGPNRFGGEGSAIASEGAVVMADPYISNFTESKGMLREGVERPGFWPMSKGATYGINGQAGFAAESDSLLPPPTISNITKGITTYTSIQQAIDAADPNDTITVAAGILVESNIVIDKPLKIYGAQNGTATSARTFADASETVIYPADEGSASPSSSAPYSIFRIASTVTSIDGLEIKGFSFDGNNTDPLVSRSISRGGVDIDADAVLAASTAAGVKFENLVFNDNFAHNFGISPTAGFAVQLRFTTNDATFGTQNMVRANAYSNVGGGVLLERNYAQVTISTFDDAGMGVSVGAHDAADDVLSTYRRVEGNTFNMSSTAHLAQPVAISYSSQTAAATGYDIYDNTITSTGAALTTATGIRVLNVLTTTASIYDNEITGGQYGYMLSGNDASAITIGGTVATPSGVITGAVYGVYATTDTVGGGDYTLNGVTISNSTVAAIDAWDQGTGTVEVTVTGSKITGGAKGIVARGGTATVSASNSEISGQSGYQYDNTTATNQVAECNYWGTATGPAAGKINENIGLVDYTPYRTSAASTECIAPTVSNVSAGDVVYGNNVTVSANVVDNAGGSGVASVEYSINGGTSWNAMAAGVAPSYSATITMPDAGSYTALVRATDNEGNISASVSDGFTVTKKTLTITGLTAGNKVYDGTLSVTVTGTAALAGVEAGDVVTLGGSPTYAFTTATVGTAKSVVAGGFTISGADAGNYTLNQPSLTADITPKGLTISGMAAENKAYDGTNTATISFATAALVGVISPDVVTIDSSGAAATFADETVGTAKAITVTGVALGGAAAGNYTVSQPTGLTANITAAALTVTGLTGDNKTYDTTTVATATGTAALSGVASGDTVTLGGTPVYTFATANAGTGISISTTGYTLGGADASNYTLTQPTLTANILKKQLSINADAATKQYGSIDPVITYTLTGFAGAETVSTVTITGTASCTRVTGEALGTYTITCAPGTLASANYSFATGTTADLTISAKVLTVSGLTGDNKVYDGTTAATATGTATLVGVVGTEVVTLGGTPVYTFANKTVGTAKAISTTGYTLGGANAGNYTLTQPSLTGNITKKGLTVTGLTGDNRVYDATTAATASGTAALSGVVGGDTVSLAGTAVFTFADKNVGTGKTISTTGYTLGGGDAGNYQLTQPSLTGNITAATLTVSGLTGVNRQYDGTTVATATGTPALVGVIGSDVVSIGGTPVYTFASAGVANGVSITTTGFTLSGADSANYTLTQPTLSANITLRVLTVTGITANNKGFDGSTVATVTGTPALSGVVAGETVTLGGVPVYTFTPDATVGTAKSVTTTGFTIAGADSAKYTLTQPTLTADITAAQLTATITVQAKTYDGLTDADIDSCTLSGVNLGFSAVTCDFSTATASFADANAGTGKALTGISGLSLIGLDKDNYTLSSTVVGTGVINQAQLSLNAENATKVYGAADPTLTYTLSGFIAPDDITNVTITGAPSCAYTGTTVGSYTITCTVGSLASTNYFFAPGTTGLMTITKKTLTVSGLTGGTKVYNGTTAATASGAPSLVGIVGTDTVTLGGTPTYTYDNKNVGTGKTISTTGYTLGGGDAGNYQLTQPTLSGSITAAALVIAGAAANDKTYDSGLSATVGFGSASLLGVFGADAVTINSSGYSATFASKNVGAGIAVTVTGVTLGGTDAGNYTVSQPAGLTASILPAPLYVNAVDASKTYGSTDPAITYTISGFVGTESAATITVLGAGFCSRATGEDVGTYAITCFGGSLTAPNYTFVTGTTGLLTINPLLYGTTYNTPVGTNVDPQWGDAGNTSGVSVNFPSVTTAGNTTVTQLNPTDPGYVTPPIGLYLGTVPMYFDITSTAVFTTPVTVCFNIPAGNFPLAGPGSPQLYHYTGGSWNIITTSYNPATGTLCGQTTTFSPFAAGVLLTPTAAKAEIGGRVADTVGSPVAGARVRVFDSETGETFTANTNQFGRYSVTGLTVGRLYIVSVAAKGVAGELTRELLLNESQLDVDFGLTVRRTSKPPVSSSAPIATETTSTAPIRLTVIDSGSKKKSKKTEDDQK